MLVKWNSIFNNDLEDMIWTGKSLLDPRWSPSVDISEDEKKYTIEAEIPGVKEEDVSISLENKLLTISGKKETKKGKFTRTEIITGSFSRSFSLPETISPEQISAKFLNGILTIDVPKAPKKEPAKIKINISSS